MEIMQIAAFSVLAAFMALSLRKTNKEMSLVLSLGAGLVLLAAAVLKLADIVSALSELAASAHIQSGYLEMLLKIIGISSLSQLAAQTCRDAGEEGLAQKTEFAAKAVLLSLLIPIALSILQMILEVIP